jgi:uncharacterized DUF497 family protein
MDAIKFDWNEEKNKANKTKHGVSFKEAITVFYDENARLIYDPEHSSEEKRFIILGLSNKLRLLLVVHCYRENEEVIRIVSARKASKKESKQYKEFLT